jgi:hypothetical protein
VQPAAPAHAAVDLLPDCLQVPLHDVLDVALVPRLRPAALVVLARYFLALVDDLDEPPALEAEHDPPLARDHRDDRPFASALLGDERGEPELRPDFEPVGHGVHERHDAEEPVGRGDEDRERAGPVAQARSRSKSARSAILQSRPREAESSSVPFSAWSIAELSFVCSAGTVENVDGSRST